MDTTPKSQVNLETTDERDRLECDKIRAEIANINKPLFQTAAFYSAMAPVVLAIIGLIFSWSSGWFDVQHTRLSNEKTLLEAQTERLKTERTVLEAQAHQQQEEVVKEKDEIQTLKEHEFLLTNQLAKFERELAEFRGLEDEYQKKGWWLLKAKFPDVTVAFVSPKLKPTVVIFAANLSVKYLTF